MTADTGEWSKGEDWPSPSAEIAYNKRFAIYE